MRQREHTTNQRGDNIYPEIDKYIQDAELVANDQANKLGYIVDGKLLELYKIEWSALFMDTMDDILSKKGLRVL